MLSIQRIFCLLTCSAVLFSCNPKTDYKAERDEVMKFHDVVMADHGVLVNNEMKLDTMLRNLSALKKDFPSVDTAKEKVVINIALESLKNAENKMNDWMHQFEPDVTGKSNDEAVAYFKAERQKIGKIDSLYKGQIKASNQYLSQFKK